VLAELKRLNTEMVLIRDSAAADRAALAKTLNELRIASARLEVRAGIWGAVAGVIPVFIMIAIKYIL